MKMVDLFCDEYRELVKEWGKVLEEYPIRNPKSLAAQGRMHHHIRRCAKCQAVLRKLAELKKGVTYAMDAKNAGRSPGDDRV